MRYWILWFNLCFILFFNRLLSQLCCSFLFGEYGLIGEGLCCRLRDLDVLFVWVMYRQRSSWLIKSCGTFASRTPSPNVSHPCGLKYFLLRSTSLAKSTMLLPWTVSPLYFSSPFLFQLMSELLFTFFNKSCALALIVFLFVVDQVLFHGFRCDCHGSGFERLLV